MQSHQTSLLRPGVNCASVLGRFRAVTRDINTLLSFNKKHTGHTAVLKVNGQVFTAFANTEQLAQTDVCLQYLRFIHEDIERFFPPPIVRQTSTQQPHEMKLAIDQQLRLCDMEPPFASPSQEQHVYAHGQVVYVHLATLGRGQRVDFDMKLKIDKDGHTMLVIGPLKE